MSTIQEEMPIFARNEGDWIGKYILIDIEATILDRIDSHITCQFPTNSPYSYYQINHYKWPDGKQEEHCYPATYRDKKLWFNTDNIQGYAWEVGNSTIMLWFDYKIIPDMHLYEMIQISPCNNYRARTCHWFKNNQIIKRTLVQEERLR